MVFRKTVAVLFLALAGTAARGVHADEETHAARARQVAALFGLGPLLDRVVHAPPPASPEEALARASAVEQAIIQLARAGLAMDATLAHLGREESQVDDARAILEGRHDHSVTRLNIAGILVGSGASVVGTGMQFGSTKVADAGDALVVAGSAVAAALSIVALVKREVGPLPLTIETNLLAPLLDRPATARSRYPDWIWRYLDTPLVGAPTSIRRQLIDKWTREGKLPPSGSPDRERRLTLLAGPLRAPQRVDANVLDDRGEMLTNVRERLAGVSEDLELLWRQVQALGEGHRAP